MKSVKHTGGTHLLDMSASAHQASMESTANTMLMNAKGTLVKMGVSAQIWLQTIPVNAQGNIWEETVSTNVLVHWAWKVE